MSFGSGAGLSTRMHNIGISGRRTTVRLEDEMWESLKDVAEREGCSVSALASRIYRQKKSDDNFSSAIRIFLMLYYRDAATEAGHAEAGHARIRMNGSECVNREGSTMASECDNLNVLVVADPLPLKTLLMPVLDTIGVKNILTAR